TGIGFIDNYTDVFTQTPMSRYFLNSLTITIPSVIGVLVLSTLAGVELQRHVLVGGKRREVAELHRDVTGAAFRGDGPQVAGVD
ncbi:hypothetical protein ACC810_38465, partial [Rhizobium ruizarguesonis]